MTASQFNLSTSLVLVLGQFPAVRINRELARPQPNLLHAAEIVIEPIEGFLEPRRERHSVAGIQQDLAFVRQRCSQKAEKRLLTGFKRESQNRIAR